MPQPPLLSPTFGSIKRCSAFLFFKTLSFEEKINLSVVCQGRMMIQMLSLARPHAPSRLHVWGCCRSSSDRFVPSSGEDKCTISARRCWVRPRYPLPDQTWRLTRLGCKRQASAHPSMPCQTRILPNIFDEFADGAARGIAVSPRYGMPQAVPFPLVIIPRGRRPGDALERLCSDDCVPEVRFRRVYDSVRRFGQSKEGACGISGPRKSKKNMVAASVLEGR